MKRKTKKQKKKKNPVPNGRREILNVTVNQFSGNTGERC